MAEQDTPCPTRTVDRIASPSLSASDDSSSDASETPMKEVKPCDILAAGLLNVLKINSPTVRNGLKMKLTLKDLDEKFTKLVEVHILDKEAYVTEALNAGDRTDANDTNDVSYCAAIVVLEIMGCNDSEDTSAKFPNVTGIDSIITQALIGIRFVCERIEEMLEFERKKGAHRASDVEGESDRLEHERRTTGSSRPAYIGPVSRKTTTPNLEGNDLVLPKAIWNKKSFKLKVDKAMKEEETVREDDEEEVA